MKLSNIFGLVTPVAPSDFSYTSKSFAQYTGLGTFEDFTAPSVLVKVPTVIGIEVEVESISKDVSIPKFWTAELDGSLRNHGKEFKSVPLMPEQAFIALAVLWKTLHKASGCKPDFSWRSSIHYHINMLDLEDEEFRRFVRFALLFEQVLFNIVGEDREQSNFCVPLLRSTMTDHLRKFLLGEMSPKKLSAMWNAPGGADGGSGVYKYSSINFARLCDIGTVEFRMLGGTSDLATVYAVLSVILALYKSALTFTETEAKTDIMLLNTSKTYKHYVNKILGPDLVKLLAIKDYQAVMYDSVVRVKEMMTPAVKFKGPSPNSSLMEYAENVKRKQDSKKEEAPKPTKK